MKYVTFLTEKMEKKAISRQPRKPKKLGKTIANWDLNRDSD
jgi:hypothetical protein